MAECILNNTIQGSGKDINVKSRGLRKDYSRPYIARNVVLTLKELGFSLSDSSSEIINEFDITWADKIIIVADNISKDIFPKDKSEYWDISDCDETDLLCIQKVISKINSKVEFFLKGLGFN